MFNIINSFDIEAEHRGDVQSAAEVIADDVIAFFLEAN